MKKLFTIIIIASFAITMQAQDIINTLGSTGSFLINKNDGTNYLRVDPFGKLNLGGGPSSSYLNGGRDLNLVKEGGSAGITLTAISNGANARARMDFAKANGTIGALSTLVDNDEVSYLTFYGHDGGGYHLGASLEVSVDGNVTPGTIPMQFDFFTNDTASRLTIKADGKVGIGAKTPTSTLDVHGSMSLPIRNVVGSTTLDESDYTVTATGTSFTVFIPQATSSNEGRVYVIKHGGGNGDTITVDITGSGADAADKIDGSTTQSLSQAWSSMTVQSTGATWVIIASKL
jgi:hypothetical protein